MYDDPSDMIKLFSDMVANLQLYPHGNICSSRLVMRQLLSEDFPIHAITGDLDEDHYCDELNLYATREDFIMAKKKMHHMRCVWPLSNRSNYSELVRPGNTYMQAIPIRDHPVPSEYSTSDLYITQDMEGFDKVVNRLITTAKIMLL